MCVQHAPASPLHPRHRLLGLQQDNTLLRNYIADSNLDAPKSQPKCSVCSKPASSASQPASPPDSTLLLTLNKQLQQQLQQAQLQLQQQQKKAKDQLEQHQLQAQVGRAVGDSGGEHTLRNAWVLLSSTTNAALPHLHLKQRRSAALTASLNRG